MDTGCVCLQRGTQDTPSVSPLWQRNVRLVDSRYCDDYVNGDGLAEQLQPTSIILNATGAEVDLRNVDATYSCKW